MDEIIYLDSILGGGVTLFVYNTEIINIVKLILIVVQLFKD